MPKLPIKKLIGDRQERCLYCYGTKIIRKGKRRKKFETVQLWYCKGAITESCVRHRMKAAAFR